MTPIERIMRNRKFYTFVGLIICFMGIYSSQITPLVIGIVTLFIGLVIWTPVVTQGTDY